MLSLRSWLDRCLSPTAPFRVLFGVFLLRVVDLELLSADADTNRLLSQFAAIFAAFSFITTAPLIMMNGGLPVPVLWTMEHFFIATTMLVVGLFTVLAWESIFPDRRDLLILSPLPVKLPTLFCSKLTALVAALALATVSLNCISGTIWPLLFSANGFRGAPRAIPAYWLTMAAAGAFTFCVILSIHGIASLVLSRQLFLRVSSWLQTSGFCFLIGGYILEPSLESIPALTAPQNQHLLRCLPTYWFLGLFQQLNGSMQPAFARLAQRAWLAMGVALCAASVSVFAAYFRSMPQIVEEPDILPGARRSARSIRLGSPLASAIFGFTTRTLLRSRQHRVLYAFYAGVGITMVIILLKTPIAVSASDAGRGNIPTALLAASYLMLVFAIFGTRVAIALPISVRANWLFRITETRSTVLYHSVVRQTMLAITVLPVCVVCAAAALFLSRQGLSLTVAAHLVILGCLGAILVEVSLGKFNKVPFTASYLPGKANIHFLAWITIIFLIPVAEYAAGREQRVLGSISGCGALLTGLILILGGIRWWTAAAAGEQEGLRFDEAYAEEIISMRISG
jgi:hypothetical protein